MVNEVNVSSATADNLFVLQKTTKAIKVSQERLSTGLRVGSAIDDSGAFFTAQTLTSKATDLLVLKDSIGQAASTLETAVNSIASITSLVQQMKGVALSAESDSSSSNRSKSAVQFNDLRSQLDNLANDATFGTTNLIKGSPANLKVTFSEDGSSTMTISGIKSDSSGLSITTAAGHWTADSSVDEAINDLDSALTSLRSTASVLGTSASFVNIRLDFVSNLINALEEGASKLVDADLNEESANLLTLQTRQQLGTISLSIAQQSEQAVFRLF